MLVLPAVPHVKRRKEPVDLNPTITVNLLVRRFLSSVAVTLHIRLSHQSPLLEACSSLDYLVQRSPKQDKGRPEVTAPRYRDDNAELWVRIKMEGIHRY